MFVDPTFFYQKTLKQPIYCRGIGVHSGKVATLNLKPAGIDTGYLFIRSDIQGDKNRILGHYQHVTDTRFCTKLTNPFGVHISTVEHLLAALAGSHIHNVIIDVNGPEIPIMDGSAIVFSQLIKESGVEIQQKQVLTIKIKKPVRVSFNGSWGEFYPSTKRTISIQFDAHGRLKDKEQEFSFSWDEDDFAETLSDARTFGFYEDAEKLWASGLAQGASLENTIVINEAGIMNEGGLRSCNELVRHKLLDAVGDFSLAGGIILGAFKGYNPGHMLNNLLLKELFNNSDNFEKKE